MDQRTFSVVIATYRRPELLRRAMASIFDQDYPTDRYELIVVDNAGDEATSRLVHEMSAAAPIPVTYLVEAQNGVSAARNRGAIHARFDYVAFLDDDATASPDWLAAFDAVIREHHALVVGGRTVPVVRDGTVPPPWFNALYIQGMFGANRRGRSTSAVHRLNVFQDVGFGGGNSAYARRLFDHFGGFPTTQGRTASSLRAAEDTHFNLMLERHGIPIFFTNAARIDHLVDVDRLPKAHIRRRSFWHGVSGAEVRVHSHGRSIVPRLIPGRVWAIGRGLWAWRTASTDGTRFPAECVLLDRLGFLVGLINGAIRHHPGDARAISWGPREWLAEVHGWPEGIDKQRRLYEIHRELGDEPAAQAALERLVAALPPIDQVTEAAAPERG